MTDSIEWRRRVAVGCLVAAVGLGLAACGDDDNGGDTATAAAQRAAEPPPPPDIERTQSLAERRVVRSAFELQRNFAAGNFETVCAELTTRTATLAAAFAKCPAKLAKLSAQRERSTPTIAWVRIRGGWGNVVVRGGDGQLRLSPILYEGGEWRFGSLELVGITWP